MYRVYKHTTPSGKVYIGITSNEPKKRWGNGCNYASQHFCKAIKKYGWENIKHEVLLSELTKEEAEQKEIELIKLFDATNPNKGYNETLGGNCRKPHSVETREKMSVSRKGKKHNEEWKKHQKESVSKIQGVKVLAVKDGKVLAEYESIREASRNAGVNEATMRGCCNGGQSNIKGTSYIYKDEKRRKIFVSKRIYKTFICIETNKIYKTLNEAVKDTNVCRSSIDKALKGKRNKAGGYTWRYITETPIGGE